MDEGSILNKLLDWLVMLVGGYTVYIHNLLSKSREEIGNIELDIAKNYTTRQDHEKTMDRLELKMDLILAKLDKKVDKN